MEPETFSTLQKGLVCLLDTTCAKDIINYLIGLSSACIAWSQLRLASRASNEKRKCIVDLQAFYRLEMHGEAGEMGRPLNKIVDYILLSRQNAELSTSPLFQSLYSKWRDYTAKTIEQRLASSISSLFDLVSGQFPQLASYYADGYQTDYVFIESKLNLLATSEHPRSLVEMHGEEVIAATNRLYRNLFNANTSALAELVNSIPVSVISHLRQSKSANDEWIVPNNIDVEFILPDEDVKAFMSSFQFSRVIDEIFDNIKEHNFCIGTSSQTLADKPFIKLEVSQNVDIVHIMFISNGPGRYNNIEKHGLRTVRRICSEYGGKFDIANAGAVVLNTVELGRW
jgi:hypothetical protein